MSDRLKMYGIKDDKLVELVLEQHPGSYVLVEVYPDGKRVYARYQPGKTDSIPDIWYWAKKNGFSF